MQTYIKKFINNCGLEIYKQTTSKNEVLNLIKNLRPYKTEYNLIRLGPKKDGGYLVPNDLDGIEACFSPGCDNKYDFEWDALKRGMKIFIADKTVASKDVPKEFDFEEKFIGPYTSSNYITLANWVNSKFKNKDADLLLQMDIEGDEYQNILNMSEDLTNRFRIILIEFHSLDKLFNLFYFKVVDAAIKKLLETHTCVHLHPNNSSRKVNKKGLNIHPLIEATFIRNDRIKNSEKEYYKTMPNTLDYDCLEGVKSEVLDKLWYK